MPPAIVNKLQGSDDFKELKMTWKLDKGIQYKIVIEHNGDIYDKNNEE